jgi:DNA-binding FadR family transcriptional regulator
LHDLVIRQLATQIMESDQSGGSLSFPNEAQLCRELGVSRSILRESMKVLADKGMIEMGPRVGTHARPRSEWRLLDPDILAWQTERCPSPQFLRELCEVRLAIEPSAAGFAALRATPEEIGAIGRSIDRREALAQAGRLDEIIDLDLDFHTALIAASHNSLFQHLDKVIRHPFRAALGFTSRLSAAVALGLEAHRSLIGSLQRRDPLAARKASEEIVGFAMLAIEEVIASQQK